ncbi:hypothetical protein [Sulfitobacter sp. MF3-043]|uniref:hypothetical protein n=1 Tax=Sulfitobacter sediminivivens TaxID=3252902 RepID=UPI0036DCC6EB
MSSILLSNPFLNLAPPPSGAQPVAPVLGVAPLQKASAGNNTGNPTSFSGSRSGSGHDQQSAAEAIRARARIAMAPPSNATSTSVVNAQTQVENDIIPFGANLPKVEMPDPLPTSPFLLRLSEND